MAAVALLLPVRGGAQAPVPGLDAELSATTPLSWAKAASDAELRIIDNDGSFPLRYRIRKIDAKNDIMRDVIESKQGPVARLIQRDGRALTPTEDAAERERLTDLLKSPGDLAKHRKRETAARTYSMQLVRTVPQAMLFTFVAGQPQYPSPFQHQVVIDFAPDPRFKPPNMVSDILTGVAGRLWIDRKSKVVTRIEGRVLKPVDFGWGVLARIFPGGTVEFEQANAGGDRWAYAHLRENVTIREMLVKTAQQNTKMDAANFELLPAPVEFQDAIRMLLATPLPR